MRAIRTVALASVVVLVAACGTAGPAPSASPSTDVAPSPSLMATPTPSPSPSPQRTSQVPTPSPVVVDPAPVALAGRWQTTEGERVTVTFVADRYAISRGPGSARGRVAVRGERIEFFDSDLCVGSGLYTWRIDGDVLTISPTATADPCGNRSDAIVDRPFAKL